MNLRLLLPIFVILFLCTSLFATNGYFSHGYGTQQKSMAGIGVAMPLNSSVIATNPAGLAFLDQRYDVSLGFFNPNREYTVSGAPSQMQGTFGLTPGTIESDTKYFVVPSLSALWLIDSQNIIGAAIYGNGGMNTDYATTTFYGSKPVGVNLNQLFVAATYTRLLSDNHSLGISAILAYQMFEAKGLEAFVNFSREADKLTNNDSDNSLGFGGRVGYMGKLTPELAIGASYQTKISMGKFEEYKGLFAEQGGFDIPSNWTAGLAYTFSEIFTLSAEYQQIMYSEVKSVANPFVPADFQQGILLGDDDGAGFGWKDMSVVKVGANWLLCSEWAVRAGYSVGEQPIPSSEVLFNILAPGVIEQHLTAGFSKFLGDKELSVAFMYGFSNSVTGPNPMEIPNQQTIEIQMSQFELELGFAF